MEGGASVTIKPTSLTARRVYHDPGRSRSPPARRTSRRTNQPTPGGSSRPHPGRVDAQVHPPKRSASNAPPPLEPPAGGRRCYRARDPCGEVDCRRVPEPAGCSWAEAYRVRRPFSRIAPAGAPDAGNRDPPASVPSRAGSTVREGPSAVRNSGKFAHDSSRLHSVFIGRSSGLAILIAPYRWRCPTRKPYAGQSRVTTGRAKED